MNKVQKHLKTLWETYLLTSLFNQLYADQDTKMLPPYIGPINYTRMLLSLVCTGSSITYIPRWLRMTLIFINNQVVGCRIRTVLQFKAVYNFSFQYAKQEAVLVRNCIWKNECLYMIHSITFVTPNAYMSAYNFVLTGS